MCYREPELMDNDSAKNILWNCFEGEMLRRSKEDYTDSDLDFSTIVQKAGKTKELKKRKFAKYQNVKEIHIAELEDKDKKYSEIIVREDDIDLISEKISSERLREFGISEKHIAELQKLYAVLMIISKRLESDRPVGKNKQICHVVNSLTIHNNRNNGLNFSNLSKLCNFTDYQRKNIKNRLKELYLLGVININQNKMDNIKFKVIYEKISPKDYDVSMVEMDDYKKACEDIMDCL